MIIDCIGCLHGAKPKLEGGDLLIITGDLTAHDIPSEYLVFREWLREQDYRKKVFIAGNHDVCIESGHFYFNDEWMGADYLYDSGTEFEGLKLWGSPWTNQFPNINPNCCAFTRPFMEKLEDRWEMIPADIDIVITHGPPFGVLDQIKTEYNASVGSMSLLKAVTQRIKPKLHVFSHVHEQGGKKITVEGTTYVNCSIMDERYRPLHGPVRIDLDD